MSRVFIGLDLHESPDARRANSHEPTDGTNIKPFSSAVVRACLRMSGAGFQPALSSSYPVGLHGLHPSATGLEACPTIFFRQALNAMAQNCGNAEGEPGLDSFSVHLVSLDLRASALLFQRLRDAAGMSSLPL